MKVLLVIALATVAAGFKVDPFDYLEKYGYTQSSNAFSSNDDALTKFQKFAHLPVTGILDEATLKMMEKPRCGVKDIMPASFHRDVRKKRYVATSRYRKSKEMTYKYYNYNADLGREATRRIIRQALDVWSNATNVVFREVTGTSATLTIRFQAGKHDCPYPFDGEGGTLAHAFYPDNGGVHFDEAELFTDGESRGKNLLWVATHEFGHSLGLPHSDVYEALMYPWYKRYVPNFQLPADDTGAIQALYGCKNVNRGPVSIPRDGAPYKGLLMERWLNSVGSGIHHIEPDVCIYPHHPDNSKVLQSFEAPSNSADNFATRIRGYYRATKTGYHTFYLCADDSAKLYVSLSTSPADKRELITVGRPTSKELSKCEQERTRSQLQAGRSYYIEAIHKDSSGDDFLKLGVKPPGENLEIITSQSANWALTNTDIRVIVCLGRYEALICPSSHKIEVSKAAYGMYSSNSQFYAKVHNLCNFDTWSKNWGTSKANCEARSSMSRVQAECQGKQQCTLYAHDSAFPDHCGRRVYSVLDVTYKCVANGLVTPSPQTQAPTPGPSPSTAAPNSCIDKRSACQDWAKAGYCSMDHIRTRYCRKSCNDCIVSTTPTPCADRQREAPHCKVWKDGGYCSTNKSLREFYCRKTCGTCK